MNLSYSSLNFLELKKMKSNFQLMLIDNLKWYVKSCPLVYHAWLFRKRSKLIIIYM